MTLKRIIFWHYRKYDFIVIKAEYGILKSRWGLYIFYNFYFCFLSLYELFIFHLNECAFFRKVIIRIYASFFYALHQLTEIVNLFQLRCSCRFFLLMEINCAIDFFFFNNADKKLLDLFLWDSQGNCARNKITWI